MHGTWYVLHLTKKRIVIHRNLTALVTDCRVVNNDDEERLQVSCVHMLEKRYGDRLRTTICPFAEVIKLLEHASFHENACIVVNSMLHLPTR